MIHFDLRDFTKSALSLAAGMSLVIGFAYWRSNGDTTVIWLTAGLPVGVLSFWSLYILKMRAGARNHAFVSDKSSVESLDGLSTYRFRNERRTLKPEIKDPAKARLLKGRPPKKSEGAETETDQWHQV